MKWHLLTMDFYLGEFPSYADAKRSAQNRFATLSDRALRPKRVTAGFYEIGGSFYVATAEQAKKHGFELDRMIIASKDDEAKWASKQADAAAS